MITCLRALDARRASGEGCEIGLLRADTKYADAVQWFRHIVKES